MSFNYGAEVISIMAYALLAKTGSILVSWHHLIFNFVLFLFCDICRHVDRSYTHICVCMFWLISAALHPWGGWKELSICASQHALFGFHSSASCFICHATKNLVQEGQTGSTPPLLCIFGCVMMFAWLEVWMLPQRSPLLSPLKAPSCLVASSIYSQLKPLCLLVVVCNLALLFIALHRSIALHNYLHFWWLGILEADIHLTHNEVGGLET